MLTVEDDGGMEHSGSSVSGGIRCEVCASEVAGVDNFCRFCGHHLRHTDNTSIAVSHQNAVQQLWGNSQIQVRRGVVFVAIGALIGALARSETGRSVVLGVIGTSLKSLAPRRVNSARVKAVEETIVVRRSAIAADK